MRLPKRGKDNRRPRLQVDVEEYLERAVAMAAAKSGTSISNWVVAHIKPHLSEEIPIAMARIASEHYNSTAGKCNTEKTGNE